VIAKVSQAFSTSRRSMSAKIVADIGFKAPLDYRSVVLYSPTVLSISKHDAWYRFHLIAEHAKRKMMTCLRNFVACTQNSPGIDWVKTFWHLNTGPVRYQEVHAKAKKVFLLVDPGSFLPTVPDQILQDPDDIDDHRIARVLAEMKIA
jgi:hypothetical protein